MKVSRTWLNKYFVDELPSVEVLAEALTFHAFEIEEAEGDLLDVKVLPDRAAYALSHRGIAREISAVLELPLKSDPLTEALPSWPGTENLTVEVDSAYCLRHTAALVRGVKVGPSPAWLQEALVSVGQRSINNIVDATNYVMLDIGQPMHAFDAGKIAKDGNVTRINIRAAQEGEEITVLTGEKYTLTKGMYVIADKTSGAALDIAGLKGGAASGVTESTTDLFVSVGNYDGTLIRKMSQALKLYTDASQRYQNRPSPELTAYGMREVLALIQEVAGGTLEGVVDVYPKPSANEFVSVSLETINSKLGSSFTNEEVESVFVRLGFDYQSKDNAWKVKAPFERRDIHIPEDVVEEVGRILGYDRVPAAYFSADITADQARYRGIERIKDFLVERGFTEVSTPSFAVTGDIVLANPLDKTKPALRSDLYVNMTEALVNAAYVGPRVLGPVEVIALFEMGNVFTKAGERFVLALGFSSRVKKDPIAPVLESFVAEFGIKAPSPEGNTVSIDLTDVDLAALGEGYAPRTSALGPFQAFSQYPFALRDIAVWTPTGTSGTDVQELLQQEAGNLLVRLDLFDAFDKEGRTSYAFRLVFESPDRTLSDEDLNPLMERITAALNARDGWHVR